MLVTILIAGGVLVTTGLVAVISDFMRENRELRDEIANWKYRDWANRNTAQRIHDELKLCTIERSAQEDLICDQASRLESNVLPIRSGRGYIL